MIDKMLLTSAFQKLGPDRVERGLKAADGGGWSECFLARAYGEARELMDDGVNAFLTDYRHTYEAIVFAVAVTFGLSEGERLAVTEAFDESPEAFRALAAEWLEAVPEQVTA